MHYGSTVRKKRKGRELTWRNNRQKLPKLFERHGYKIWNQANCKQDGIKETHTETHYDQLTEVKNKNILKPTIEKWFIMYKLPQIKLLVGSHQKPFRQEGTGIIYLRCWKKKEHPINRILYPAKLYFKIREKLRHSKINKLEGIHYP